MHRGTRESDVKKRCLAATAFLAIAIGCATYTSRMELSRDLYYEGRYGESLEGLNKLVKKAASRDHCLLLLERGKVNLVLGNYDAAIADLQEAEKRFQDIEATTSVSEVFKSILVNPTMGEYQPEPHEQIMISSYLLLAYWLKGDREGAFVERNRIVGKLDQYISGLSEKDRASLDVPFARYLAAVLYEVEGREDDARIEYDAVRALRPDEAPLAINSQLTELVVFAEVGRAPVKVSTEIRGYLQKDGGALLGFFYLPGSSGPQQFSLAGVGSLSLDKPGVLFTFAFPQCVKEPKKVRECKLVVDGVEAGALTLLDDLEGTAYAAYQKDLGATLIKAAFRTYIKTVAQTKLAGDGARGTAVDVLGKVLSAVDRADTRSWQTLPAEIRLFRMECAPGSHQICIKYLGGNGEMIGVSSTQIFSIQGGAKYVLYMP